MQHEFRKEHDREGHGFSRADQASLMTTALAAAANEPSLRG
jgi:hypothetical protein